MRLLIVNLSIRPESTKTIVPIGLGYIATAVKRAGFHFDLLDMDIDKKPMSALEEIAPRYDVIAMGCIVTGYKIAKEACRIIRKVNRGCKIIVGNTVAGSIPATFLVHTDANIAVVGEGDGAIINILHNYNRIQGKSVHKMNIVEDINTLPMVDWDIFDIDTYIEKNREMIPEPRPRDFQNIRAMPVNTARGCLHKCTFCYQAFYGQRYRYRSAKNIKAELVSLKEKYGVNFVTFYDDLTIFSRKRAKEFADMLEGMGIQWTACCRADLFTNEDRKLIRRLKKAGCVSLGYSLESANEDILKSMKKKINLGQFAQQKKVLDEAGIATLTSIVVGYPQETEETLNETFNFCSRNGVYPSTGYLLPQPGTPMYKYAKDHGFIGDDEEYLMRLGDRQDLRLNMTAIPSEKLEAIVHDGLKRLSGELGLSLDEDKLIKTGVEQVRRTG